MRRKHKKTGSELKKQLKDIGVPLIKPLKEILDYVDNAPTREAGRSLKIIDSQILARNIELIGFDSGDIKEDGEHLELKIDIEKLKRIKDNPEKSAEFDYILGLMNEITVLRDKKSKIEGVSSFIDAFQTD